MSDARAPARGARRLGVLGTLVWDTIWHPSADGPVEQWGGLTYSLASLAAARPPGWRVHPLVKVGEDLAPAAHRFFSTLPGLELEPGFRAVREPNNRVELRYLDGASRHERLTGGVPRWSWEELEPLLEPLDSLYLNFISGLELDLATTRAIRAGFHGPIYADLHSLFLSPPGSGPRTPRALPDWEAWLGCFDAIQLNEAELALLCGPRGEPGERAAELLGRGPLLVAVTLGGAGAYVAAAGELPRDPLAWRASPPKARAAVGHRAPLPEAALDGDPTGCGDVWGSGFWTGLLAGLSPGDAARRANRLAACKVRHPDTGELFGRLREALAGERA